jgi:hypothetical protein
MKDRALSETASAKFAEMKDRVFESKEAWENCLEVLWLHEMRGTLDPCMVPTERALWGAIRHQRLADRAVILSDETYKNCGYPSTNSSAIDWVFEAQRSRPSKLSFVHRLHDQNSPARKFATVTWKLPKTFKKFFHLRKKSCAFGMCLV